MTPYTLLFFYPASWREHLICFLGRMKYVHVSVVIGEGDMMTESSFPHGVRTLVRGQFDGIYKYSHDSVTLYGRTSLADMCDWAADKHGIRYGIWDCVQAFLRENLRLKVGGNPGGVSCSEHAAYFMMHADTPGVGIIDTRYGIKPDQIYDIAIRALLCQPFPMPKY